MSLLDGRHVDTVRAQRETQAAIAARRAAVEAAERQAIAAQKRAAVARVAGAVLGAIALVAGGWLANQRYRRNVAADAALDPLAAPYLGTAWSAFPRPIWRSRDRIEVTVGPDTCVVALASTAPGSGRLAIERPSGRISAATSTAFCTRAEERLVVSTDGDDQGAVQLLYKESRAVGGNLALPFLTPRPASLPVTETCKVDAFDAWLSAGHGASPLSAAGVAAATSAALDADGFRLVASAPSSRPFAVVPGAADGCFLAFSTVGGEELSLRMVAGQRPLRVAPGSAQGLGWCTHVAQPVTVSRVGTGSIVVYGLGATAAGGTLGLRELAGHAGLGDVPLWVSPGERGWDASAPLLASGVAPVDITLPTDDRPVLHTRVVSLTLVGGHVKPKPDEIDRYACAPSLEPSLPGALCVQSTPLGWETAPGERAGIAESPLPFWMDLMTRVEDRAGLAAELQLLALSRKLSRQHYEATAREGVLEERDGIEVVGREGDDRIIALGILATAPWVLPYTDGPPWTLTGDPYPVDIASGNHLHLVTVPKVAVPPDVRRTVVFRHRAR